MHRTASPERDELGLAFPRPLPRRESWRSRPRVGPAAACRLPSPAACDRRAVDRLRLEACDASGQPRAADRLRPARSPRLASSPFTKSGRSRISLISSISCKSAFTNQLDIQHSECVPQQFNLQPLARRVNRDDIEAHLDFVRAIAPPQKFPPRAESAFCLRSSTASSGAPAVATAPRLHLDEHQRLAVHRDEIDFRSGRAKIPRNDPVADPPQILFGSALAAPPKRKLRSKPPPRARRSTARSSYPTRPHSARLEGRTMRADESSPIGRLPHSVWVQGSPLPRKA